MPPVEDGNSVDDGKDAALAGGVPKPSMSKRQPVKGSGMKSLQQDGQRRMSIARAAEETFICT
jgi:hypothetical protein